MWVRPGSPSAAGLADGLDQQVGFDLPQALRGGRPLPDPGRIGDRAARVGEVEQR